MQIGEEIIIQEGFELEGLNDKKQVKKGDKGFIDSHGLLHYTTGAARGKIQPIKDVELKEYDVENIAKIIMNYLNYYPLTEMLEDYDIDKTSFRDTIAEALDEIL